MSGRAAGRGDARGAFVGAVAGRLPPGLPGRRPPLVGDGARPGEPLDGRRCGRGDGSFRCGLRGDGSFRRALRGAGAGAAAGAFAGESSSIVRCSQLRCTSTEVVGGASGARWLNAGP